MVPDTYRQEIPRDLDDCPAKAFHEDFQRPIARRVSPVEGLDLDPAHIGPCRHQGGPTDVWRAPCRVVDNRAHHQMVGSRPALGAEWVKVT